MSFIHSSVFKFSRVLNSTWRGPIGASLHPLNSRIEATPKVPHSLRCFSSSSDCTTGNDEDKVSNTSVFVQDGLHIEELPCIVRVVKGEFAVYDEARTLSGKKLQGPGLESRAPTFQQKVIRYEEEEEMISGFCRCSSLSELYFLLCQCPEDEVTPPVAFSVIRNVIQLENNNKFRNPTPKYLQDQSEETPISELVKGAGTMDPKNFTRAAVMERLVDKICKGNDAKLVLETVKALRKDTSSGDKTAYIKRLCDKCLLLVSDGKLTLSQITALAQDLHLLNSDLAKSYTDKLWIGLEEHISYLDANEVSQLFSMLPYINQSRKYVYQMAERQALAIWFKFEPDHILQMLCILITCQCYCYKLLGAISRWMNLHIHTITEENLRWIVFAFNELSFTNDHLQKALVRYAKVKKSMISDPYLVSALMDYSASMRFRNPVILEMGAEFLIANHTTVSVPDVYSICNAFGVLNYVPTNSFTFFKVLENLLNAHFVAFSPDTFVNLLLTCVYLERYPLNFIEKVYHPFFFQRVDMLSSNDIRQTHTKLKVLDKALSLEASCYQKRMVSGSQAGSSWMLRDVRITKCANQIRHIVEKIAGSSENVHIAVNPMGFPFISFYKIDCLVDLTVKIDKFDSLLPENCQERLALLIHLPYHYDLSQKHLLGPYAMKARHLALAGYKVVHLDHDHIMKSLRNPDALTSYLLTTITSAL